eukprot:scaffold13252_cov54-Attheya_sp.AAC.1
MMTTHPQRGGRGGQCHCMGPQTRPGLSCAILMLCLPPSVSCNMEQHHPQTTPILLKWQLTQSFGYNYSISGEPCEWCAGLEL